MIYMDDCLRLGPCKRIDNPCTDCPFQCSYMCKNCHEFEDFIDDPEVNYES